MKKITKLLALVGMSLTASLQGQVFFSEYAEGTSNNKYLEIYNGSGSDVNLEDYLLVNCSNGCKDDGIKGAWQMTFLGVGPAKGNTSWYSTVVDESIRSCLHDDYVIFHKDGVFQNAMGDETFLEGWQHSGTGDICGAPAAPFDGKNLGTWKDNGDGTVTVYGQGSHIGIPKVHNGGETSDGTAKDSITYEYTITNDSSMVIEIEINNGAYWTFHYVKAMNTFEYDNSKLFSGKTLKSGEVFVIAHGSAQADIKAEGDVTHNFLSNGNDWYALWKKSDRTFVDEIGENTDEDNEPSAGWDVAGTTAATKDNTLIRKSYVKMGSTWSKSAGTTAANSEWVVSDKPTADYVSNDLGSFNTPVGAWKMIYLGVGPSKGDGSWYNSTSDPTATDIILSSNGDFQNFRGDCVKPDNGSWMDNEDGTFTVVGKANFVGIHKVFNGGETSDGSAANKDSITYEYEVYGGDTMQVDIEINNGAYWRFLYVRRAAPSPKRVVKFAVDMSGETVSSNGIHVAGSFQGWSPSTTTMTDAGNGIYEVHACVDVNTLVEYKFLNDNDWGGVESVPAISQKGHTNNGETNDNRWFWSGAGDDTLMLPAFVFGGSAPSGKYAVRLAVDLKSEDAVSADGVHVAGSIQKAAGFPEWNPSATQMVNLYNTNKIHEVILCVADGDYEYKFVNGNAWGKDESVPSSCATNNNRGVSVSAADVEAKLVCFGSCDACPGAPLTKFKAIFQIDMKKECNFEKVDIAGGKINGWAGGDFLTDDDMDGVYTITLELDSGVEIAHKVRKIDADGNISWEGGSDRKYFVHNDTTFAVRCFGLDEPCSGSVIAPADITFKVDMSNEIPEDTVYVMGSFTSPAWQSGALPMTPNVDNPDIYEVTVEKVCNEYFEYKFVNEPFDPGMNGETFPDTTDRACVKDNGVGGFNRHYTRTSDEATELFYVYNSCTMGSSMATKDIAKDVRISPNPASGVFYVTLKDAKVVSIDVMSLDGRIVRHTEANDSHVKVNVNGLNGVYLVNIQDQFGRSTVQKIVIQ
jgi:hypothetical protein